MNTNNNHVQAKRGVLDEAILVLKKEFIGIDGIIDEMANVMLPWWLFPEHQNRPLIINLWGMTGSGKTALVKRLFELIDFDKKLLRFDMGEFGNNSSFLKYTLTGQLSGYHESNCAIVLDEFQFAKTKDETGKEVNNTSLRIIWDLLDSGQITYEPSSSTYYLVKVKKAIKILLEMESRGLKIKNGVPSDFFGELNQKFNISTMGYQDGFIDRVANPEPFKPNEVFFSDVFCTAIYESYPEAYQSWHDVVEEIKDTTNVKEFVAYLNDVLDSCLALKTMDLRKSLIFVIGNLDEAYSVSNSINPDIDADEYRRHTLKITIADVKSALQNRFRNEQIARLGNNHLIYHAFSRKNFEDLISMHLNRMGEELQQRFGLNVSFTPAVHTMLYAESVFPTQGVRPVVSTLRNHIESNFAKIMLHYFSSTTKFKKISWDFKNDNFLIHFDESSELIIPAILKIDNLRKTIPNDFQAMIAVHEAGHTIASVFHAGVLPEYVITRTVDSDSNGFAYILLPEEIVTKRVMLDKIHLFLGGYVAEKLIFGSENNTTGVNQDLATATTLVHQMFREFGMNDEPYKFNLHQYGGNSYQFTFDEKMENSAKLVLENALKRVEDLMLTHKKCLLTLARFLSDNSRINKNDIRILVENYCAENNVKVPVFVDKDSYYDFRNQLFNS